MRSWPIVGGLLLFIGFSGVYLPVMRQSVVECVVCRAQIKTTLWFFSVRDIKEVTNSFSVWIGQLDRPHVHKFQGRADSDKTIFGTPVTARQPLRQPIWTVPPWEEQACLRDNLKDEEILSVLRTMEDRSFQELFRHTVYGSGSWTTLVEVAKSEELRRKLKFNP
jgi:hypothetical protein